MPTSITSPVSALRSARSTCRSTLHRDDLFLYDRAVEHGRLFGLTVEPPPPIDHFYSPGEVIRFGDFDARPHHTPGHCPGGVCLAVDRTRTGAGRRRGRVHLFVGDTLFAGSIGRTDLPGGDHATLIHSIRSVLVSVWRRSPRVSRSWSDHDHWQRARTNPFLVHV